MDANNPNNNIIPQPRIINSCKYRQNYEEIEWRKRGTYCFNCGKTFKIDENRSYYEDGNAFCYKECNFNQLNNLDFIHILL